MSETGLMWSVISSSASWKQKEHGGERREGDVLSLGWGLSFFRGVAREKRIKCSVDILRQVGCFVFVFFFILSAIVASFCATFHLSFQDNINKSMNLQSHWFLVEPLCSLLFAFSLISTLVFSIKYVKLQQKFFSWTFGHRSLTISFPVFPNLILPPLSCSNFWFTLSVLLSPNASTVHLTPRSSLHLLWPQNTFPGRFFTGGMGERESETHPAVATFLNLYICVFLAWFIPVFIKAQDMFFSLRQSSAGRDVSPPDSPGR